MNVRVDTDIGIGAIGHPTISEAQELIDLLKSENLDLRRLVITAQNSYPSQGEKQTKQKWGYAIKELRKRVQEGKLSRQVFKLTKKQSQGVLNYQQIPSFGTLITDPFNMKHTEEQTNLSSLQQSQLENILILKMGDKIISSARVLPVEGIWEIVSIVTTPALRKKGIGTLMIHKIFENYPQRPLFSFQKVSQLPFYLNAYSEEKLDIPIFSKLPFALQRDLFYMNIFWEPYLIIRLEGKKYRF